MFAFAKQLVPIHGLFAGRAAIRNTQHVAQGGNHRAPKPKQSSLPASQLPRLGRPRSVSRLQSPISNILLPPTFVSGLCSFIRHGSNCSLSILSIFQPESTSQTTPSPTIVSQIYFPLPPAPLIVRPPLSLRPSLSVSRPSSVVLRPSSTIHIQYPISIVHHPPPNRHISYLQKGRNQFIMPLTRCPMPAPGMGIPKGTS
jgi:hypothetical protein